MMEPLVIGAVTKLFSRSKPLSRSAAAAAARISIKRLHGRRSFALSSSLVSPSPSHAKNTRYHAIVLASTSPRRCVSVFSHFITDEKPAYLGDTNNDRNTKRQTCEWHFPEFMSACTIAEKETWLENLLEATDGNHNSTNSSNAVAAASDHSYPQKSASGEGIASTAFVVADVQAFLVVLKALASIEAVADAGAARRADTWMNRLLEYHRRNSSSSSSSINNINNINNISPNTSNTNSLRFQPTPECYQYVIQAWANSNKEQVMVVRNRSERWLNDLLENSGEQALLETINPAPRRAAGGGAVVGVVPKKNHATIKPTIECFNAFLDGLTRGREGKSKRDREILVINAKLAESILRRLHSVYSHCASRQRTKRKDDDDDDDDDETTEDAVSKAVAVRPNTETFNYVIRGWTRCKHERNVHKRVLAILRLMEGYQRENPTAFINDRGAPRPNTKSYAMAMDALVGEAKQKARRHCNYQLREQKHRGNNAWYGRRNNDDEDEDEDSSLNGIDELNEAAAILQYMHDLHDAGVEGVVPHRVPYNILITGWAALASFNKHRCWYHQTSATNATTANNNKNFHHQSEEFRAEGILRTMMSHREKGFVDASPDVISYERVILAWANSGHPNAGKRALWWLKQLWGDYDLHKTSTTTSTISSSSSSSHESSLRPTVNTYNVVMKALSCTDGALAAENLLLDLGDRYKDSTNDSCGLRPNSESFAIVIRAWLESAKDARNVDDKITSIGRAYEWLSSLRGIENEDNLSTAPQLFTGLLTELKSCAKQRPHVLDLAQQIFDDFKESRYRLDCVSYATLLKIGLLAHYERDDHNRDDHDPNKSSGETTITATRERFVEKLFSECCDDGLVGSIFVRTLVDDPSIECKNLVDRTLRDWPLPLSWSRNLRNDHNKCSPSDLEHFSERNNNAMLKRRQQRRRKQQL